MLYPLSYGRALDGSYEVSVLSVELGGDQGALRAKNFRNRFARKLTTQNSLFAVGSGYTGLWASGSRDSILACVIHDGSSPNPLDATAGPFAGISGLQ